MDPRHSKITQIALEAAAEYGFALAGGYAVSAHGMGHRLSGDVDLFTDWQSRDSFPRAVDAVIDTMQAHGYSVSVVIRHTKRSHVCCSAIPRCRIKKQSSWNCLPTGECTRL